MSDPRALRTWVTLASARSKKIVAEKEGKPNAHADRAAGDKCHGPPEDTVFPGLPSESGRSPSRKVRWLGGAWGTFSDHCTPEQSFQSQGDAVLFEAYIFRGKLRMLTCCKSVSVLHYPPYLKVAIEVLLFHVMILSHIPARRMT